jgi:hypothetical protein
MLIDTIGAALAGNSVPCTTKELYAYAAGAVNIAIKLKGARSVVIQASEDARSSEYCARQGDSARKEALFTMALATRIAGEVRGTVCVFDEALLRRPYTDTRRGCKVMLGDETNYRGGSEGTSPLVVVAPTSPADWQAVAELLPSEGRGRDDGSGSGNGGSSGSGAQRRPIIVVNGVHDRCSRSVGGTVTYAYWLERRTERRGGRVECLFCAGVGRPWLLYGDAPVCLDGDGEGGEGCGGGVVLEDYGPLDAPPS